jgi:hypothetical protein
MLPQLSEGSEQIDLLMPDKDVQVWEHAVLVTNSAYPLAAFGQLHRDVVLFNCCFWFYPISNDVQGISSDRF